MITPKETLDELMMTIALELVKTNNLRTDQDEIVCWNCKGRIALMPSLHCRECLAEAKRRLGWTA